MATPILQQNILGVYKALKDDFQTNILSPMGLTIKSTGTKDLALSYSIDPSSGYWVDQSKSPRWIIHVETDNSGNLIATFPVDSSGSIYRSALTVGAYNNVDGTAAVHAIRVLVGVKPFGASQWNFPSGWECLLIFGFSKPLEKGTSSDSLSDFNISNKSIMVGPGSARVTRTIDLLALLNVPGAITPYASIDYNAAVDAIATLIGATVYDGQKDTERDRLSKDLLAVFGTSSAATPFVFAEDTALVGVDAFVYKEIEAIVNSGKRHIILYGPPGTGKTTLSEYLARELSEHDDGDGSYLMLTASSSWSAQDLVGGYQPMGAGAIGFIPGAIIRNFDKPVIIDELNRCPIDKVLGPLFSVLSGQGSTLPCREDVTNPTSKFHVVLPEKRPGMASNEHAPGKAWHLICTLNTYDKTQLGQISYALSRRFGWVKIGAPKDLDQFVIEIAKRLGITVPSIVVSNPLAGMWKAVNSVREIGGAPIIDSLKILKVLDATIDPFLAPSSANADIFLAAFRMCVLPLMDGLSPRDAKDLAELVAQEWTLDAVRKAQLIKDCEEFSA